MGLIKKIDVEEHFAARRAMRLGRMKPLSQLGTVRTKSPARSKRVSAPVETPTLKDSSSSVSSASIPITPGLGRNRLLRPSGSRQQ
jgi:hypothetical protein